MNSLLSSFEIIGLAQTTTPWITNPGLVGGLLGSAVGIFGATYGTIVGIMAPRGKGRTFVFALHWTGVLIGLILIGLSVTAFLSGQPYGVWYGLGLPGLILAIVLLPLTGVLRQHYRQAEQRRLDAESFRRG